MSEQKVAVIGSGPAGLTVAADCAVLVNTPVAVEEVTDVVDVSRELECVLLARDVEVNILSDLHVEATHPRSNDVVSLGVLTSV